MAALVAAPNNEKPLYGRPSGACGLESAAPVRRPRLFSERDE